MKLALRSLALVLCTLLAACASPRAVVTREPGDRYERVPTRRVEPRTNVREYVVARGDTLYGIAFRHGVDFRALARWNAIAAPYTIYPGQRLRLTSGTAPSQQPPRPTVRRAAPDSITGMPTPTPAATTTAPPAAPVAAAPSASTPSTTPPVAATGAAPAPSPAAPSASQTTQGVTWRWPASGELIGRFVAGDPTRQGINVAGKAGQPIFAAAGGEVVYSGAGLIGYGELVIIKHSDVFLSAYGHNRKRLVAEGQRVAAGQQIAEMGRTGAARDMLHFEIRRSGKPIDPLPLLPKK
jgi:lipoprotein NlpD